MDKKENFVSHYLERLKKLLDVYQSETFDACCDMVKETYLNGQTLFICGNGGSLGTANHMVNDLSKGTFVQGRKPLRVIGLDSSSNMTAFANDEGYEQVFVGQMKTLWNKGDVLLAISASGNSANAVKAAQFAKNNGGRVIALVGFSGGELKTLADVALHFEADNFGLVEDAHMVFSHLVSQSMRSFIESEGPPCDLIF
jgi:D-sedoheptulose 7-phosphate isomerase